MDDFVFSKKLHLPFGSKPKRMKAGDWNLLDMQVLGVIRLTMSKNMAYNVAKEKTIMGMMQALANLYENPSIITRHIS